MASTVGQAAHTRRSAWLAALTVAAAACGGVAASGEDPENTMSLTGELPAVVSTVAPSTLPPTTTIPPVRTMSMAFSGDVLIHSPIWEEAEVYAGVKDSYNFAPMWDDVRGLVSSVDLAICHLEVPIAPPGQEFLAFPLYASPKELIAGIASAGYDRCSIASNHAYDMRGAGIDTTLALFEQAGMGWAGTARSAAEIEPRVIEVKGIKVSHLSYTWSLNGLRLPADEQWRVALIDSARIIADCTKAREMGAEAVIVSMHWGTEPVANVTTYQQTIANEITASGQIDLIVGHHSHVVQPIRQVNGVWTVFGMGNSLSSHPTREFFTDASQDGVVVVVNLSVTHDGKVTVDAPIVHPTWVDKRNGYVIRDVLAQLARTDLSSAQRATYEKSLERTKKMVGDFVSPTP